MPAKSENPKVGRPQAQIDVKDVRVLAAADLSVEQIADALEVSVATMYVHFQKNPALREAFENGRMIGNASLLRKAFSVALSGDAGMLRFLIKNRVPGYSDMLDVNHRGAVLHGVAAVGGMSLEEVDARLAVLKPDVVKLLAAQASQGSNGNGNGNGNGSAHHRVDALTGSVRDVDAPQVTEQARARVRAAFSTNKPRERQRTEERQRSPRGKRSDSHERATKALKRGKQ